MYGISEKHLHGAMRRKDREIVEQTEIDKIIRMAKIMRIALSDDNIPFVIPVFYGYNGTALFFHSAQEGTKIEILKRNNTVCFEICIDHGIIESDTACDFEARHCTVIGLGKATFVEDEEEKIRILDMIVGQFSERKFEYPKANLNRTAVIRIDIESIKGKKHGMRLDSA